MNRFLSLALLCALIASACAQTPRVIEITADKDSRFKVAGDAHAQIMLTAGEAITLRITAIKAKEVDREGSAHGFVLVDKNGDKVMGWSFQLKPGVHDLNVVAPAEPGEYQAICNVICSTDHEGMRLKVKVLPKTQP